MTKINKFLIAITIIALISITQVLAAESISMPNEAKTEIQEAVDRQIFAIQKIKDTISKNSKVLKDKSQVIDAASEQLGHLDQEITEIKDLIAYYDREIESKSSILLNLSKQTASLETDIFLINDEIEVKEYELTNQKHMMEELITILYLNYDTQNDATTLSKLDKNPVKMFLSSKSFSENLREEKYLSILEDSSEELFDQINDSQEVLMDLKDEIQDKKSQIEQSKLIMDTEKQNIEDIKAAKELVLSKAVNEKDIFQERLSFAKKQQEQIVRETEILFKTLQLLNSGLDEYRDSDDADLSLLYELRTSFENYDLSSSDYLMWPASPGAGITAVFADPSYPFASAIGNHSGVDVRMVQGTPLLAPMNGIITYSNGYGVTEGDPSYYAFHKVVITDESGRSVVLGHVSDVFVKKGDLVQQGDLVALSGALPGTRGAGAYTTGAHLHLELHIPKFNQDGSKTMILTDPLLYFPLELVPLDSLTDTYLANLLTKRQDILDMQVN